MMYAKQFRPTDDESRIGYFAFIFAYYKPEGGLSTGSTRRIYIIYAFRETWLSGTKVE
jgi:hypothetical protein